MGYRARPNSPKRADGKDKYVQGQYNLTYPSKYLGDPTCIWFRSSWEYKLYFFLDNNPRVLHWNVEGITIPYEIMENERWTTCRYHPDAYAEIQKLDGTITKTVIEIKPYKETIPPESPKRNTAKSLENHEYRMKMYIRNLAKWKAAKKHCDKIGVDFVLMTERYFENTQVKLF